MSTVPPPVGPVQQNHGIRPLSDKVILSVLATGGAAAVNGWLGAFVLIVLTTGVLMSVHAAPQALVEYQRTRLHASAD